MKRIGPAVLLLLVMAGCALQEYSSMESRGRRWINRGNYAQAIEVLTRSLESNPTAEAYLLRGTAYERQGKYREALRDFDAALEQKESFFSYYNRGVTYKRLGEFAKAAADFQKAAALSPETEYREESLRQLAELPEIKDFVLTSNAEYNPFVFAATRWHLRVGKPLKTGERVELTFRIVDSASSREFRWTSFFERPMDSGHVYCFVYRGNPNLSIRLDTMAEVTPDKTDAFEPGSTFVCEARMQSFELPNPYRLQFQLAAQPKLEGKFGEEFLVLQSLPAFQPLPEGWSFGGGVCVMDGSADPPLQIQVFATVAIKE